MGCGGTTRPRWGVRDGLVFRRVQLSLQKLLLRLLRPIAPPLDGTLSNRASGSSIPHSIEARPALFESAKASDGGVDAERALALLSKRSYSVQL